MALTVNIWKPIFPSLRLWLTKRVTLVSSLKIAGDAAPINSKGTMQQHTKAYMREMSEWQLQVLHRPEPIADGTIHASASSSFSSVQLQPGLGQQTTQKQQQQQQCRRDVWWKPRRVCLTSFSSNCFVDVGLMNAAISRLSAHSLTNLDLDFGYAVRAAAAAAAGHQHSYS
jgi:hypothetical protein